MRCLIAALAVTGHAALAPEPGVPGWALPPAFFENFPVVPGARFDGSCSVGPSP